MTQFSNSDAHVGLLVVDWEKRSLELRGMHPDNEVSADDVLTALRDSAEGTEVQAVVYWIDQAQLCLYDEALLLAEVGVEE